MELKLFKRKICIWTGIMAVALLVVGCRMSAVATPMSAITSDSIRDKESKIAQMEKDRKTLQSNLSDLQKIKKDLEKKKSNLKDYVAQLDAELSVIEQRIVSLKTQIATKEAEIDETQLELTQALDTEQHQQEAMVVRMRLMYERNDSQLMEMLMQARGFSDFLNRADYVEKIILCDKQLFEEYQDNRHLIELCKEQLELEKEILDQTKANVEVEQANLEELIDQKNRDITNYETDIRNKSQTIAEYEQMIQDQDSEIAAMEAAIAEEKKRILANSGSVISYDGGTFKFPLASYTRVSDDYGNRIHPTLKVQQFHNGVDFAAPKGTAIYAAYDGKVAAATYSATMGNYIMIDHGDGLYTIYMHASALYVKSGDVVVRGETIAAVGSTGRSTGNHLHFSVRQDGSYVSPWNYITK